MKILFVVHRYYPFPGGSEYNVRNMAEECVRRGFDTWVLTDEHQGDQNGVRVTSDRKIAFEKWDMIVVHGSCPTQDFIHANSAQINQISPINYLLIQPSNHPLAVYGMQNATWLGCGTSHDFEHVEKLGLQSKMYRFTYGIPDVRGQAGFRQRYNVRTTRMFVSAGGFWPHKRMGELRNAFVNAKLPDSTLILMGYDSRHGLIPTNFSDPQNEQYVKILLGTSHQDVLDAMAEGTLYVSYSSDEGYGLVLLEAMLNECDWASTNVGGADWLIGPMQGHLYNTLDELMEYLRIYKPDPEMDAYLNDAVHCGYLAKHSVDSLLAVLEKKV